MTGCCPHGETTLCQHGRCDECDLRGLPAHDEDAHRELVRREWEAMFDPTSDLYYSDAAAAMRADAGIDA